MALRHIRPRKKLLLVPRPFCSSSNPPFPPPPPPSNDPKASSHSPSSPAPNPREAPNLASSLFQDIRERLRSSPTPPPSRRIPITPPRPSAHAPPPSLDDIRRTLESYRGSRLSGGASPPSPSPSGATPSFQDLLRNSSATAPPQAPNAGTKSLRFDTIRESFHKLYPQPQQKRPPHWPTPFLSPTPHNIFKKELGERDTQAEGVGKEDDSGIALTRDYNYEELGKRLGELRPADVGKDGKEWFSLEELLGRIAKLAELEKKEDDPRFGGQYAVFRKSLMNLNKADDKKNKFKTMPAVSMLNIGGERMSEYMLQRLPPQDELLERYFHPDHMSSEEKMKLELQRVRDEFKMSENDCGSARVQIAQLTVKIKHLSAVLHKKDKHSRKGLTDMVQQRKKYLKYLRRTDWDSYCLVLSKLGLRDVPQYKAPDYKSKSTTKAKSKKSKSKSKSKSKRKMKA